MVYEKYSFWRSTQFCTPKNPRLHTVHRKRALPQALSASNSGDQRCIHASLSCDWCRTQPKMQRENACFLLCTVVLSVTCQLFTSHTPRQTKKSIELFRLLGTGNGIGISPLHTGKHVDHVRLAANDFTQRSAAAFRAYLVVGYIS